MEHARGMGCLLPAMAPILAANMLTVTLVYCLAKVTQKALKGEEEDRLCG